MTGKTVVSSEGATPGGAGGAAERWYALSPDDVAQKLGVDPASGISAAKAAELLKTNGPNALPAEKPPPGWRLFLAQYKSYMQIILVGAAIASIVIGQIATGVAVLLITALNALGGLRQQGKAESAMNALQSMLKTTARVRRDGSEVKVGADQVVVGDVVLLAAGDDVCADGRLVEATSLQIDESALTGESVPASKSAEVITDQDPVLGDQSNMAFMNTPVTHGSGVMIVTGTGADTAVGKISGMLKSAPNLKTPLTKQLDTLTLWIAAAAGLTIAIMFAVGISRGESTAGDLHDGHRAGAGGGADGDADGAPGHPVQRVEGSGCARRRGEEPRLGGDAGLDVGDQLGQDRHAHDEPGHRRRGDRPHGPVRGHRHGLRPRRRGPPHRGQHEHDRGGRSCRS